MSELSKILLETAQKDKWKRIGTAKRAGILVPLFSVYSKKSAGIGEFADLNLLVDWCTKTGNSIIQLLPMNEMGGLFCPYDAESSFALEPCYCSLRLISGAEDKKISDEINKLSKTFPTGERHVDYQVKYEKLRILWKLFTSTSQKKKAAFTTYCTENNYWLDDFALFKVLKYYNQGKPWYEWAEPFKYRDSSALEIFHKEHPDEILFQKWVQWQLFTQFTKAKEYATSKGILIKGDLPVLVSRDSADVWAHPNYFKLDLAAGAPPDMYVATGQRWGMPPYEWNAIAADEYIYKKEKLKYAENFYDLLRIDHVVGLFRIWSIPEDDQLENKGLNGFFDPYDESVWEEHGRTIISMLTDNTSMLLCAEDLGAVPPQCPPVLQDMGIPGNDVQRWKKDWETTYEFLPGNEYRPLAVGMLSTHDTLNWASWWTYQAGCIDEPLFKRMCSDHGIDFDRVNPQLFSEKLSKNGYLRWNTMIDSPEKLAEILERPLGEIGDIISAYNGSYLEKNLLWGQYNLKGSLQESCTKELITSAFETTLNSSCVFTIEVIYDWLFLTNIITSDPWQWRFNVPGTISLDNWSLVMPLSLEELLAHPEGNKIKELLAQSGRSRK